MIINTSVKKFKKEVLQRFKRLIDKSIIYYIDNNIYFSTSLAKMPQHKSADVICQCGAI